MSDDQPRPEATATTSPLQQVSVGSPAPSRKPGRPPRDAASEDSSREKLLDAAIELFADWGFEPVSTTAVAKAAGLTQSMVHYHFGAKEQLWREAVARLMRRRGRFFPVGRFELNDVNPLDRLRILVRRLVEANAAEPHYMRIITHEAMANTSRFSWLMETYVRPGIAPFDAAISAAMDAGHIRRMPVHDVSNLITSAASMPFSIAAVTKAMYGHDVDERTRVSTYSDSVMEIVMNGLAIAPPDDPTHDSV